MAEEAEVAQSSGTPEQLPQGAASQLNAANPYAGDVGVPVAAPEPDFMAPEMEEPSLGEAKFVPGDDPEEQMLFLPQTGPAPGRPFGMTARLPMSVLRMLPAMREAASRPNAPRSLKMMYAAAVNALERDLRG